MKPDRALPNASPSPSFVTARPRSRRSPGGGFLSLSLRATAHALPFALGVVGGGLVVNGSTREAALRSFQDAQLLETSTFLGLLAASVVGLRLAFACCRRRGWRAAGLFHGALSVTTLVLALEVVGWGQGRPAPSTAAGPWGLHEILGLTGCLPLVTLVAGGGGLVLAALGLFRPLRQIALAPSAIGWCLVAALLSSADLLTRGLLSLDPSLSAPFSRLAALALAVSCAVHFARKLDAARLDWKRSTWRSASHRVVEARRQALVARHCEARSPVAVAA